MKFVGVAIAARVLLNRSANCAEVNGMVALFRATQGPSSPRDHCELAVFLGLRG